MDPLIKIVVYLLMACFSFAIFIVRLTRSNIGTFFFQLESYEVLGCIVYYTAV